MCVRRWMREEVCVNSIFMKENPTVLVGEDGGGHTHKKENGEEMGKEGERSCSCRNT